MNTLAPEFSALMIIFRSTGPVISTRRSARSGGIGATSPIRLANEIGFRQEIRLDAFVKLTLPLAAAVQQVDAALVEAPCHFGYEIQSLLGQDLGPFGRHTSSDINLSSLMRNRRKCHEGMVRCLDRIRTSARSKRANGPDRPVAEHPRQALMFLRGGGSFFGPLCPSRAYRTCWFDLAADSGFTRNMHFLSSAELGREWKMNPRWAGIKRPYTPADTVRLRGSVRIEYTLARMGAERLWSLLHEEPYVPALGALTGNQAVQQVKAGLKAIYLSGWQVAADANLAGEMYPDQSLYPANSVPAVVRAINNAFLRADQLHHCEGDSGPYWFAPIVADAEAGFGGPLNAFELMKAMIAAGAAGVHFEDQLASAKKCGHMGGKVLEPASMFIPKLVAARLAADTLGVSTILIARTDANSAKLVTSAADVHDAPFLTGERTSDGFLRFRGGLDAAIVRGLLYAPHADLLWCETSEPNLEEARRFADAIHDRFPDKLLAYNCSPSFNWKAKLDASVIARFQRELGAMGYKFQFVTLAGFHALNLSMFELARGYQETGMSAYAELQEHEFRLADTAGYSAVRHQRFVGTGYFDEITKAVAGGMSSTTALTGSTEDDQFSRLASSPTDQWPRKERSCQCRINQTWQRRDAARVLRSGVVGPPLGPRREARGRTNCA